MGCTKETDLSDLRACCAWDMETLQYNQDHTGDPVNVVTGAFTLSETDLLLPCQRLPLVFARAYDSLAHQEGRSGDFGPGWAHSYDLKIQLMGDDVHYFDDRHTCLKFQPFGDQFIAPPGAQGMRLTKQGAGWTLRQSSGLTANFNAAGQLTQLIRPGPRRDSILNIHRTKGRLDRVEGATGTLVYGWVGDRITSVTDPVGRNWKYEYDRKGLLVAAIRPSGIARRYSYDSRHQDITTANGQSVAREIVGMRHVFADAPPDENSEPTVTNVYTSAGRVALQIDVTGGMTRFAYNRFSRINAVTDPEGWTTLYAYDEHSNVVRARTPEGRITEYIFDDRRNLLASIVEGARTEHVRFRDAQWFERVTEFGSRPTAQRSDYLAFNAADLADGYDDAGNPPILRDPLGNITSYSHYNSFGNACLIKLPNDREIRTTFDDRCGLPIRREHWYKGSLRNCVEWTLDDVGNIVQIIDGAPDGPARVERSKFDSSGTYCVRRESYIGDRLSGLPLIEHFLYDSAGRLVSRETEIRAPAEASPRKRTERTCYDIDDNIICEIRNGDARAYDWNAGKKTVAVWQIPFEEAPDGPRTLVERITYDLNGRMVTREDAAGGIKRCNYDGNGRITRIDLPDGSATTFSYDRDGRIIEQRGKQGTVQTSYDGRKTTTVDALGRSFTSEVDVLGRLVRTTLDGKPTTWEYLADTIRCSFPDGTTEISSVDEPWLTERGPEPHLGVEWVRDIFGRPLELRAGRSGSLRMRRKWTWNDAKGERTEVEPNGIETRIVVDNAGQVVSRQRLASEVRYDRDELGRILRWHSGDGTLDLSFSYTPTGQLASVDSQRFSEQWEHDDAGRPTAHTQVVDGIPFRTEMKWDEAGRLREATAGAWWIRVSPEADDQHTQISIPGRTAVVYRGQNCREIRWDDGSYGRTEFTHRGMVSSWQEDGGRRWQWTIEADELGRPASEIRESPTGTHQFVFRYDAASRLVSVNDETGRERLGWLWDAHGNLVQARRDQVVVGQWTVDEADRILEWRDEQGKAVLVKYNEAGHLVRARKNEIEYDAGGRPRRINDLLDIRCTADGSLAAWIQNGKRNRVGWCLARPIDLPGDIKVWWYDNMVLACQIDGHTRPVWTDPRGSIVGVQGLPSITDYDPWGVSTGPSPLPLGFEGRLQIGELYDNRARLYLPSLGRFAQTDPDGVADDPNTYLYGHGNPLVWSDPTGHSAKRRGIGDLAHMPTIGLLPILSIDAYRAVGIDVASTYIKDPPFLDFGRARYAHYNKEGEEVGRTYIVGPGILETRPHFVHYDNDGKLLGSSYFAIKDYLLEDLLLALWVPPTILIPFRDPVLHLVTRDAQNKRLGSTWVTRPNPGLFTDDRLPYPHLEPHLNSYHRGGDLNYKSYLVRPGRGEARPHLVHYDA